MDIQQRFTVWGTDENGQKVCVAVELVKEEFMVKVHSINAEKKNRTIAEDIYTNWFKDHNMILPDFAISINRSLNEESLLPDSLKVEDTGKVRMMANEWAFMMLQEKLLQSYVDELEDIKQQAADLEDYDRDLFDKTKNLWERIFDNVKDKNISRARLDEIKADIDGIFDKLKNLRAGDAQLRNEQSKAIQAAIMEQVNALKVDLDAGKSLRNLPVLLKNIRGNMRNPHLRKVHRTEMDIAINELFHQWKEKSKAQHNAHTDKRIQDLMNIKNKLEKSLDYDKKELNFQLNKLDHIKTNKLELELRKAKMKLLEEKIASKDEKLKGINQTLQQLQKQN